MKILTSLALGAICAAGIATAVLAGPAQDAVLGAYADQAKAADPGFAGFDAARGRDFFLADHTGGKPDTPSCTSCHARDPKAPGQTRSGKPIDPMAVSVVPTRFSDPAEVEKWFGRTCRGVLGRECTPAEKGDVITYFLGQ